MQTCFEKKKETKKKRRNEGLKKGKMSAPKKRCSNYSLLVSVQDPTASNTSNSFTGLILEGAFIECKISMTKQMVPRGKNNNNSSSHELSRVNQTCLLKYKCG